MNSLKIPRGSDMDKAVKDVLALCDKFFDESKWIQVTVEALSGKASEAQNDQQHAWYREAAKQGDMTYDEYRADCKANIGLRILIRDIPKFADSWNRLIKDRMTYEEKLELMMPPHDYPVTRLMNKKQKSEFLDRTYQRLTVEHGIHLEAR